MNIVLLILAVCFGLAAQTWILYLAIMTLERAQDSAVLDPIARRFAYVVLAAGYVSDLLLNCVVGTLLFLELPKEPLLSPRVARLQDEGGPYRKAVATWICKNLLDPFDPSGCHCKPSRYK